MATSKSSNNRRTHSNSKSSNRKLGSRKQAQNAFFDDETKRSIIGVAIILLALVALAAVVVPSNALVTSLVATGLSYIFGVGRYILPVFLVIVGLTFLIRSEREHVSGRAALGFLMIFIAALVLLATCTDGVSEGDLTHLFEEAYLHGFGGYIGAGIAYALVYLFGNVITRIMMVGVMVIAVLVIGFSISSFLEKVEEKRSHVSESFARHQLNAEKRRAEKQLAQSEKTQVANRAPAAFAQAAPTRLLDEMSAKFSRAPKAQITRVIEPIEEQKNTQITSDTMLLPQDDTQVGSPRKLTRKLGEYLEESENQTATQGDTETPKKRKSRSKMEKPAEVEQGIECEDGYCLPPMNTIKMTSGRQAASTSEHELQETANRLQETIADFGIDVHVAGWVAGPTVTLFKVSLPSGVRVNRVNVLSDDIALALAAPGVRIFAPIPGTNYVGIEVPNAKRQTVLLGDVLKSAPAGPLQLAVGKDVEGTSVVIDLAKAPHILIGGTTGSGKSVAINSFIMSVLMRATPAEVRMILIDPKRVEFTLYNGIPHLYLPVVEDPKDASAALSWGVAEMERRLKIFSSKGVRNINQYNTKAKSGEFGEDDTETFPYIMIVIDELADLMMNVGKEVEYSISRIAQLARAAGIHLIVATQRPSANVVTGLIKSNITTRMAFTVASGIDSRVILDTTGAENLINYGDMLLSKPDLSKPQRLQACFVSEDEINAVVDFWKEQGSPDYHSEILQTNTFGLGSTEPDGSGGKVVSEDPLLWEAADIVVSAGTASTSYIQRRLSVGYSRAGRIMDMLEEKGIVGPACGSKAREVLLDTLELEALKAFEQND